MAPKLRPFEAEHYKAAGVLPLARTGDGEVRTRRFRARSSQVLCASFHSQSTAWQVLLLLGTEFRAEFGSYVERGHVLAGKRDRHDVGAGEARRGAEGSALAR